MAEITFDLLDRWGIGGVLASLFIEGSAFPFIGTFFVITVGFLLDLSWLEIAWISLLGSLVYALGSYIPYGIGYVLGSTVLERLNPSRRKGFEKASAMFTKYGIWSVAVSSPLHLGNVVPLVAGMMKMNLVVYTLLTMLGIAPTTFLFLSLGQFYEGSPETAEKMVAQYQSVVLIGLGALAALYAGWKIYRRQKRRK